MARDSRIIRRRLFVLQQLGIDPHCFYCRVPLDKQTATVDHYIPQSRGGQDHAPNYRLCCLTCNNDKGNTHPDEFMAKMSACNAKRCRTQAPRLKRPRTYASEPIVIPATGFTERHAGFKKIIDQVEANDESVRAHTVASIGRENMPRED